MGRGTMAEGVIFPGLRVQCLSKRILLLYLCAAPVQDKPLTLGPTDTLSSTKNCHLRILMNIHLMAVIDILA